MLVFNFFYIIQKFQTDLQTAFYYVGNILSTLFRLNARVKASAFYTSDLKDLLNLSLLYNPSVLPFQYTGKNIWVKGVSTVCKGRQRKYERWRLADPDNPVTFSSPSFTTMSTLYPCLYYTRSSNREKRKTGWHKLTWRCPLSLSLYLSLLSSFHHYLNDVIIMVVTAVKE